jgi:hypothetical protein
MVALVVGAALYGFALGSAHSGLYATRNLVKFPLLIGATACVCGLSYVVTARALGASLRPAAVLDAVLDTFATLAVLLASLAPPVWFVGVVLVATDDGLLGDYDLFLIANVVCITFAGTLALGRTARELCRTHGVRPTVTARVLLAWLALTLSVGGQVSFLCRPLFGLPATRGGSPPWFLWTTPDVRGASNFYEMVFVALRGAPLTMPR